MGAASRARKVLAAAVVLAVVSLPVPVAARPALPAPSGPRCPAQVADQPLSVTTPFSGTARPRADDQGQIVSTSLRCAYGHGVEPAAEVTVSWAADGDASCATIEIFVAPSLDPAPFDAVATDLAMAAGGRCGAAGSTAVPLPAVGAGLAAGVAFGLLWFRRRRSVTRAAPASTDIDIEARPKALDGDPPSPRAPVGPPDLAPVLAALHGPGGRAFARTGAGQLAALSALAYAAGDSMTGDLARAGSLRARSGRRPPPSELAGLARALAHQHEGSGR